MLSSLLSGRITLAVLSTVALLVIVPRSLRMNVTVFLSANDELPGQRQQEYQPHLQSSLEDYDYDSKDVETEDLEWVGAAAVERAVAEGSSAVAVGRSTSSIGNTGGNHPLEEVAPSAAVAKKEEEVQALEEEDRVLVVETKKKEAAAAAKADNNNNNNTKIMMATLVFGKEYAESRKFRMFMESAKAVTNWKFVIIGDQPSSPLPDNFVGVNITYRKFIDVIDDKVFNGTMRNKRRIATNPSKCNDYKPMTAFLFPEVFRDYHWWGYMDNDVVVGNLTKAYPPNFLANYDIVSGITILPPQPGRTLPEKPGRFTAWGPYTMFRNTPLVNSLFMRSKVVPLTELYDTPRGYLLDEAGRSKKEFKEYGPDGKITSISWIVNHFGPRLGIRSGFSFFPGFWDKSACIKQHKAYREEDWHRVPAHCGECVFRQGKLHRTHDNYECPKEEEVFLCHYQKSKRIYQKQSLYQNDTKFQQMIQANEFRVTFTTGFQPLGDPYYNPHPPPPGVKWNENIDRKFQLKKIAKKCAKRLKQQQQQQQQQQK